MSENLVYGADILAYGAVADGKTDCSDAFIRAIENGESLLSVPYGKYLIKKPLKLASNTKLHLHPLSEMLFEVDGKMPYITAEKDSANIIIKGGIWKNLCKKGTLFDFADTSYTKISDCKITGSFDNAVCFKNCGGITVSKTEFDISGDCIKLSSECDGAVIMKLCIKNAENVIHAKKTAEIEDIIIRDIDCKSCSCLIRFEEADVEKARICDISAGFSDALIYTGENSKLDDVDFSDISAWHCGKANAAYFNFGGSLDGVEITSFKRNADYEARPFIPSLILSPKADTCAIIDGMTLDNVINMRANSKTLAMTTAKLTNPCGKFIYTVECGIDGGDRLYMPLGDFDTLIINKK